MTDYQSHPEFVALLETIRANPADDAVRLIAADWLEEHGQEKKAATIRLEIYRGEPPYFKGLLGTSFFHSLRDVVMLDTQNIGLQCRGFVSVVRCSLGAFMTHAAKWFAAYPITLVSLKDRMPNNIGFEGIPVVWHHARFARSREAFDDDRSFLPQELCPFVDDEMAKGFNGLFKSTGHANTALSAGCVAYGRTLAGLPPIPSENT